MLNAFAFKLFSQHFILYLQLVHDLIFKNMIGLWIFDFESKVSFRLIYHFRFILCDSFGKILNDRVVVFILLRNNKFISKCFIIFFVLFDFLLQNGILLLWKFELLLFGFELKLNRGNLVIKCFSRLLRLVLFDSECGEEFLFFDNKWGLLIKFIVEFFDLKSKFLLIGFSFFKLNFNEIIILFSSPKFFLDLFVIFLMARNDFIIVSFLSFWFRFELLFETYSELINFLWQFLFLIFGLLRPGLNHR